MELSRRVFLAIRPVRTRQAMLATVLASVLVVADGKRAVSELKPPVPIKEVAVTFDDLPLNGPDIPIERLKDMTARLIAVIRENQIPIAAFVNEIKLQKPGEVEQRTALLRMWLKAPAELGNHTYSHLDLQRTDLATYEQDVIRGEATISKVMQERGQKVRYFRYPFLHTGPDIPTRKAFESFLQSRGYINAPVTIDNSDWAFNSVYENALKRGDIELARRVETAYVDYVPKIVDFFEQMSSDVLKRQVRHILLLHANELNAAHMAEIVAIFKQKGYRFIAMERALEDKAYSLPDSYAGPMGVSWLERWAFSQGMKMRVAEEPDPPEFVNKLYREYNRPAPSSN